MHYTLALLCILAYITPSVPCKVRNETETKRNETKQIETKQIETNWNRSKRNETDLNETKQNETKRIVWNAKLT